VIRIGLGNLSDSIRAVEGIVDPRSIENRIRSLESNRLIRKSKSSHDFYDIDNPKPKEDDLR
jgi:hypothetical protein